MARLGWDLLMAAYIVATVFVQDAERFASYGKAIAGLSEAHGGEYLLRGAVAAILEGDGQVGERVVVVRFPDAAHARAYIEVECVPNCACGARRRGRRGYAPYRRLKRFYSISASRSRLRYMDCVSR